MEDGFFRAEVLHNRTKRLHGEVVLNQAISARVVVLAVAAIMIAICLWLGLGKFARIETARGMLVTVSTSAKIVANTPGLVTELPVAEGSRVKKGDLLAVVTIDRRAENGRGFATEGLNALRARMEITKSLVVLENVRLSGEQSRLSAVLEGARNEVRQLAGQIALQRDVIASNRKMLEQILEVVERGFVSRHDYERRRQTLLSSTQTLAGLEQQQSAALSRAQQARAELSIVKSQSASQLDELRSSGLVMQQQEAQLRGEQAYVLVAPVDGYVTALQTAQGRNATQGATLMTVVPGDAMLRAEIYAPSRAVGLVRRGQEVRLLYDAFPYQRFGSFTGRITAISRTAIDPRENETFIEGKDPVYRMTVTLDRHRVIAFGSSVPLQPGMTLTANIVLERQSFFSWILTPLKAVLNRAA